MMLRMMITAILMIVVMIAVMTVVARAMSIIARIAVMIALPLPCNLSKTAMPTKVFLLQNSCSDPMRAIVK